MKKIKTIIQILISTIFLFSVCCCSTTIKNEVIEKIDLGKYDLYVFNRAAGATTDNSMQIAILENREHFSNRISGNVFIAKGKFDVNVFYENNCIYIKYKNINNEDVFLRKTEFKGFAIIYLE